MPDPSPARLAKRHRIRLDVSDYGQSGETWFVTVATLHRDQRPLLKPEVAEVMCSSLTSAHDIYRCDLLAYCVMPDHLHTVTHVGDGGDLIKLINGFKSYSTRAWWGVGGSGTLWQRSFHDHGLRTFADVEASLAYIWENPIRWGLHDDDGYYPWMGGTLLEGD